MSERGENKGLRSAVDKPAVSYDIMAVAEESCEELASIIAALRDKAFGSDLECGMSFGLSCLEYLADRKNYSPSGETIFINIAGFILRDGGIPLTMSFSGITGMAEFVKLCEAVDANTDIKRAVFRANTPGGTVEYVHQGAVALRAMSNTETIGFVDEEALSAGYWLVSQCDEVWVTKSSEVGSIGVIRMTSDGKTEEAWGVKKLRSSNAPLKQADASTPERLAESMRTLDLIEGVFIDDVAAGRGVTREDIVTKFGKGGIIIGEEAVRVGMADRYCETANDFYRIMGEKEVMADESGKLKAGGKVSATGNENKGALMNETLKEAVDVGEVEIERVTGILAASGYDIPEEIVAAIKDRAVTAADVAVKAVARLKAEVAALKGNEKILGMDRIIVKSVDLPETGQQAAEKMELNSAEDMSATAVRIAAAAQRTAPANAAERVWRASETARAQFDSEDEFLAWAKRNPHRLGEFSK